MAATELTTLFKTAPWKTQEAVDSFVAQSVGLQAVDLVRVLEILDNKALRADAQAHRMRILAFSKLVEKAADKALFVPLVRALKSGDPALRAAITQLLPAVNSVTDHAELCALLRSSDAQLRATVAAVLSKIGVKTVFETLAEMLAEHSFPGRAEAMDVIVSIAEHRAVPALGTVLAVGSTPEKSKALRYLASTRVVEKDKPAALKAIATAFGDPTEAVLLQAIAAYSAIANEDEYFAEIARFLEE